MIRTEQMTTFPVAICQTAASSVTPMLPWWLGESCDTHLCADCGTGFADEDIFYCDTCGRDLCPECVEIVQATRETQCSKCAASCESAAPCK